MNQEWAEIFLLGGVFIFDACLGDPHWKFHPIVILGRSLALIENQLRHLGWEGRGGGVALLLGLCLLWLAPYLLIEKFLTTLGEGWVFAFQVGVGFFLLSFRSLIDHVKAIVKGCRVGLEEGRISVARLVGRDTDKMDENDCRRAAVESLAEGLVDGVLSPLFYLALFGVPGMLFFKIVSTMDSMVGYKNERYIKFGWCGARLDDFLNYIPARLSFLLITLISFLLPKLKGRAAWKVGLSQHNIVPGPNSGWSEASMAGALGIQIAGPIYKQSQLVNELWIGDKNGQRECSEHKVEQAIRLASVVTLSFIGIMVLGLSLCKFL